MTLSWDVDQVEQVTKLFTEGKSANDAAKIMKVSRSAILGKWHRMGLKRSPTFGADTQLASGQLAVKRNQAARNKKPVNFMNRCDGPGITQPVVLPFVPPADAFAPLPGVEPVSLFDRKAAMCCWPIEIPAESVPMYCGAKAAGTYCQHHEGMRTKPTAKLDGRLVNQR